MLFLKRDVMLFGFLSAVTLSGMLWVAIPLRPLQWLNRWLMWLAGLALITGSALVTWMSLDARHSNGMVGLYSNFIGGMSFLCSFPALALWSARAAFVGLKRQQIQWAGWVRRAFHYLYTHHEWLGWVIFATATGHGVFFLLVSPHPRDRMITGIVAWILLALLTALGVGFDRTLQSKVLRKHLRVGHVMLSLAFFVLLFIHI